MLAISKAIKTEPISYEIPDIQTTAQFIESASRNDQRVLRSQVGITAYLRFLALIYEILL